MSCRKSCWTLQTANLDFGENSAFYIHILCHLVLVMTNPIRSWDTKTLSCTCNTKLYKTAFIEAYMFLLYVSPKMSTKFILRKGRHFMRKTFNRKILKNFYICMCKDFICIRMVICFYSSHSTTINALIMGLLDRNMWEFSSSSSSCS